MSEVKELGKIKSVKFGIGGYQDAMFGAFFCFELGGGSSGICDGGGHATWSPSMIKCDSYSKWTEEDRDKTFAETCRYLDNLLSEAKVSNVYDLEGKPVEVTIVDGTFKSWRLLTEVI